MARKVNYYKTKKRTTKKAQNRAKKAERALLKAMHANRHVRGNIYDVPAVKRRMKKLDEALRID